MSTPPDSREVRDPRAAAPLLRGIVVAEIGQGLAAGACGALLAQLGADVIAVESREPTGTGKDGNRPALVAGKRSLSLDRAVEADRVLLRDLCARADVILRSSEEDGAGALPWRVPAVTGQVIVDVTAFGHDGPCAGRRLSEPLLQAEMGLVDTTGPADGDPTPIGVPVLELTGAVYAAASVLLALRVRRRHGIGQHVDIALADVAVNALVNFVALHQGGERATRSGNRHPLFAPWGCYRAADGYVLLCSVSDEQFARLCATLGRPELLADPRFATAANRVRHYREIDAIIGTWTAGRSVAACEDAMKSAGIPAGGIVAPQDLGREANLVHRNTLGQGSDPESGATACVPRSPVRGDVLAPCGTPHIPARGADRASIVATLRTKAAPSALPPSAALPPPLAGVRVVEIGHYTVAPLASRILGSFGADVIKIEPPTGDAIRGGAPLREDGASYIFALSNTDKRGLVLDLRRDGDRERLHELLATADILVENLRPGALARMGLDAATLRTRHPQLVYCAVTGFGHDSVYAGRAALDSVIQAMSGMMAFTTARGAPAKTGISAADNFGGLVGMLACLAGLEWRDTRGHAGHFDISMHDAAAWMTLIGCGGPCVPASRVAAVRDGYVSYVAEDTGATPPRGIEGLSREEAIAALAAGGIAAAPVLAVGEVLAHPHVRARPLLVPCTSSDGSVWQVLASPMRLALTPPAVRRTLGPLGAEDAAVLAELAR